MTKKLLIWSLLTLASITPLLTSANNYVEVSFSCYDSECTDDYWGNVNLSSLDGYTEWLNDVCVSITRNNWSVVDNFMYTVWSPSYDWNTYNYYASNDNPFYNSCRDTDATSIRFNTWSYVPSGWNPLNVNLTAVVSIWEPIYWGWEGWSSNDWDLRGEESYNGYVWSMSNVSWNLSSSIVSFMRVILPFVVWIIALLWLFRYIRNKSKKAVKIGWSWRSAVSWYSRSRANYWKYKRLRKNFIKNHSI